MPRLVGRGQRRNCQGGGDAGAEPVRCSAQGTGQRQGLQPGQSEYSAVRPHGRGRGLFFSSPQYSVYRPVLGFCFYVPIRLLHDLLKNWQIYITEPLDVETIPRSRMFPQLSQQFRVALGAIHQVNRNLAFSWIKANNMPVAFTAAPVFVVVSIKPDGTHIPHLWSMSAYALHHDNQRLAILGGLLII